MSSSSHEDYPYEDMVYRLERFHTNAQVISNSWRELRNASAATAVLGFWNKLHGYSVKDSRLIGFIGSAIACATLAEVGCTHADVMAESAALGARVLAAENSMPIPKWSATKRLDP